MNFTTKHMSESAQTLAKVVPADLTIDERRLITEGALGYCESHHNLYRKTTSEDIEAGTGYGLLNCPLLDVCCKCESPERHGPHITDFPLCKEIS